MRNTGKVAGDEVVQVYVSRKDAPAGAGLPLRALRGFSRVNLKPGETRTVTFRLTPFQFAFVDTTGVRAVEAGEYTVAVGGGRRRRKRPWSRFAASLRGIRPMPIMRPK